MSTKILIYMAYKNKEDQKAASRRHYLKNKEKIKERSRLRKLENPEKEKEYRKKYYSKPSGIEGVSLGAFQRRKYVDSNREKYLETNQNWRDNNKEHISSYNHKYWQENKRHGK